MRAAYGKLGGQVLAERRRGDLDQAAVDRRQDGSESQLAVYEHLIPSRLVMRKAAASTCSAYACEYVALAEDLAIVRAIEEGAESRTIDA